MIKQADLAQQEKDVILLKTLQRFLFLYICLHSVFIPLAHNLERGRIWYAGIEWLFLLHIFLFFKIGKESGRLWIWATGGLIATEVFVISHQILMNQKSWKTFSGLLLIITSTIFLPLALNAHRKSFPLFSKNFSKKYWKEFIGVMTVLVLSISPTLFIHLGKMPDAFIPDPVYSRLQEDSRPSFAIEQLLEETASLKNHEREQLSFTYENGFAHPYVISKEIDLISDKTIPYVKWSRMAEDGGKVEEHLVYIRSKEGKLFWPEGVSDNLLVLKLPIGKKHHEILWVHPSKPLSLFIRRLQQQNRHLKWVKGELKLTE